MTAIRHSLASPPRVRHAQPVREFAIEWGRACRDIAALPGVDWLLCAFGAIVPGTTLYRTCRDVRREASSPLTTS